VPRYVHQPLDFGIDRTDRKRPGGITAPAVQLHAKIHAEDITVANFSLGGNTVYHLFIQRGTDIARKRPSLASARYALEKALRAAGVAQPLRFGIQIFSCHSRSDYLAQPIQNFPDNLSRSIQLLNLIGGF